MYRRHRNARLLTGGLIGVPPGYGDEHWNDVTLLLDGSGTTDLSTASSTVTPSGSGYTTGNTSGAKFGQYIDFQNSGYFNVALPSALGVSGDPFTVETWVYFDVDGNDGVFQLYEPGDTLNSTPVDGIQSLAVARKNGTWTVYNGTGTVNSIASAALSTWHHVALVYDGSALVFYVNGAALHTESSWTPNGTGYPNIGIGGYYDTTVVLDGYIEDFRVTKGVARYTSNFTPPTASFPTNAPIVGRRGVGRVPTALAVGTFATLDTNFRGGLTGEQVTENDLKYYCPPNAENYVAATLSKTTGKWYFECLYDGSTNNSGHGIVGWTYDDISQATTTATNPLDLDYGGMLLFDGRVQVDTASITSTLQATSANDVFGVAFDADTREIWFSVNGTWVEGDPGAGTAASSYGSLTSGKTYIPFIGHFSASSVRKTQAILNFGQDATFASQKSPSTTFTDANGLGEFYSEPPAGFVGLYTTTESVPDVPTLRTRGYIGAAPAGGGMLTLYDLYHSPYKLLPITDGLVLHLEAGQASSYPGSGSTWNDLSDSGYTFTTASGREPTFTTDASGIKCFNFSTGSKFFDSTTNSPFSGNSFDVTVIAVVSQTSNGSFYTVLGQGVDVAGGGMSFHSRSGQFATDQWGPTGRTMSSAASNNTVQQVAWTVPSWSTHGTSTKIYVDGTEQTTAQFGTANTPSLQAGKLRIGSWKEDRTNNDMDWRGNIYAIYVYDRVLSASEIQQVFDATKGRYGIS